LDVPLTPERAAKQHAVPAVAGLRLTVPSVGVDVPLGAISVADGQLTPPGIFSAYWVRNLGVPPAQARQGAVYVVIHSVHGDPSAPGNGLIDIAGARSALAFGDEVDVAGRRYRVMSTAVISRAELPDRADVWSAPPGTLVVITCLQRSDSPIATSNVVVEARLI
ncbi:MAG: class F sortase, partial [Marmoricola sp.]